MLYLFQADSGAVWKNRPMVALLRRFMIQSSKANGDQLNDHQLSGQTSDYCMDEFSVSIGFYPIPKAVTSIEVDRDGSKFNFLAEGNSLRPFSNEDPPEIFSEHDQFLMAAGMWASSSEKGNQSTCLEAIRFIRRHRQEIYAQFLFWQQTAELAQQ